jgi:8-oxoguanine deaminase
VRLIEQYHDPKPGSMLQIVLAPCSPFSVTGDLMRESARLARQYGVQLHTHLAETQDEEAFCLEKFGHRPVAYMQEVEWVGPDVWFAHAVHANPAEVGLCSSRLRRGTLPFLEYAPGQWHCPHPRVPASRG